MEMIIFRNHPPLRMKKFEKVCYSLSDLDNYPNVCYGKFSFGYFKSPKGGFHGWVEFLWSGKNTSTNFYVGKFFCIQDLKFILKEGRYEDFLYPEHREMISQRIFPRIFERISQIISL